MEEYNVDRLRAEAEASQKQLKDKPPKGYIQVPVDKLQAYCRKVLWLCDQVDANKNKINHLKNKLQKIRDSKQRQF